MKHIAIFTFFLVASVHAQNTAQPNNQNAQTQQQQIEELNKRLEELEGDGNKRFWQGNINGGEIMVAVDRISAISKTQYVLDGGLIVNEIVIDIAGAQALTRIYHIAPVTDSMAPNAATKIVDRVRDVANQHAGRLGTKVHEMVEKNYPTTSHAKTVEMRILDLRDLDACYASLKNTWVTGKGRVFTIR